MMSLQVESKCLEITSLPNWEPIKLTSETEILQALTELSIKKWLCRGQSAPYRNLVSSIERKPRQKLSRAEKLSLERQSIDIFRSTARFFADQGEKDALNEDIAALMVLQHYGVPTRLLDWSRSPFVAAYFAACEPDTEDGEIWSFDYSLYLRKGAEQWRRWPETTIDGSGDGPKFDANLTAFTVEEPQDWFACFFYPPGFPRQKAQEGAFSFTAQFGRDHKEAIASLLIDSSSFHLYIVPSPLKLSLRELLREKHGVWRGSLFPDSAGAASTAGAIFNQPSSFERAVDIVRTLPSQDRQRLRDWIDEQERITPG
jgi:hypothetical protein